MTVRTKARLFILIVFGIAVVAAFFDGGHALKESSFIPGAFTKEFTLGLDLRGGAHLLYKADISKVQGDVANAMASLRDAIERRVNLYGVSEPVIRVEGSGDDRRLAVELAGVRDIKEAIQLIGETPVLEFREIPGPLPTTEEEAKKVQFVQSGLDGRFLKQASVIFDPNSGRPMISIEFNDEGSALFAEVSRRNIGKPLAIFLDGVALSQPIVQEEITAGKAQITGRYDVQQAKELVRYLNAGALPVPITLISQDTVEATLGDTYLYKSLVAGLYGFAVIIIFMLVWYRLPGLLAVVALLVYGVLTLAIFKFIPVTLTTAGIAGFILSLGMAVDANILVFERMKEELKKGKSIQDAALEGFLRAWASIRDSNFSSLITSGILYWFGTSIVRGFALTLAIGILVSMFTALTVTRNLLIAVLSAGMEKRKNLFMSGIFKSAH